jgi:poly-beta-1,6-N-acetyl-D-glucosamine synthase
VPKFWSKIVITLTLYIFWFSLTLVVYTYVGYGLIISILSSLWGKNKVPHTPVENELPEITLLIAAYNEENYIVQKIENSLSLDYPVSKLNLWVVTDGSTDRTVELCKKYSSVTVFHSPERKGKIHAVNRVMQEVKTPIVIFSDANTDLNKDALKNIVRHFTDPKVGGVAGEKRIVALAQDNASGSGEGLYWKYESALKTMDSKFTTAIGAAGELFAVRTTLYINPHTDTIIEDFVTSMKIVAAGYRFVYEPDAYAIETASASIKAEWKRKVRISAGGIQAIFRLPEMLNIVKYGWISWQYVSHRALRWSVAPLALLLLLLSNIILFTYSKLYSLVLIAQITFYLLAIVGHLFRESKIGIKGFFVPYYFTMMNVSVYAGALRLLRRTQSVVWEKSARAEN